MNFNRIPSRPTENDLRHCAFMFCTLGAVVAQVEGWSSRTPLLQGKDGKDGKGVFFLFATASRPVLGATECIS
jgi:hypothetical protein